MIYILYLWISFFLQLKKVFCNSAQTKFRLKFRPKFRPNFSKNFGDFSQFLAKFECAGSHEISEILSEIHEICSFRPWAKKNAKRNPKP